MRRGRYNHHHPPTLPTLIRGPLPSPLDLPTSILSFPLPSFSSCFLSLSLSSFSPSIYLYIIALHIQFVDIIVWLSWAFRTAKNAGLSQVNGIVPPLLDEIDKPRGNPTKCPSNYTSPPRCVSIFTQRRYTAVWQYTFLYFIYFFNLFNLFP